MRGRAPAQVSLRHDIRGVNGTAEHPVRETEQFGLPLLESPVIRTGAFSWLSRGTHLLTE